MIWKQYFVYKSDYLRYFPSKNGLPRFVSHDFAISNTPNAVPPVRKADTGQYMNQASPPPPHLTVLNQHKEVHTVFFFKIG